MLREMDKPQALWKRLLALFGMLALTTVALAFGDYAPAVGRPLQARRWPRRLTTFSPQALQLPGLFTR